MVRPRVRVGEVRWPWERKEWKKPAAATVPATAAVPDTCAAANARQVPETGGWVLALPE